MPQEFIVDNRWLKAQSGAQPCGLVETHGLPLSFELALTTGRMVLAIATAQTSRRSMEI
jgi:hypothetical protein